MANINYKQSIKKILPETTDMALTKHGLEIMNKLIDSLNSRLVNYCLENAKDGMNAVTANSAVNELFTGNLLRLAALAEGNRNLMLYNNELIEYKPHYPDVDERIKRKKKTKKAIAVEALEFADGISDLISIIFPEAILQGPTERILCELLEELAMKISDFVQSKRSDSITLEDIRAAVIQLLPPELSNHALSEGARMSMLFEMGMLQETVRKRPPVKAKPKRIPKREVKPAPRKAQATRKRKRSLSIGKAPIPKRRRMPSARKVSRKKSPKTSQIRAKPKVSRRPVSRKRAPSRKVGPKTTPKKRVPKKLVPKKAARSKVPRKKPVSRKSPRKVSKKKSTKGAPSRKRRLPSKKRTAVKKRPTRVPPKTVRRISKKKPSKKKLVSKKVTPRGIAPTAAKEISQGTRKLNKLYRQKLPAESLRLATEFIGNLLDRLIEEMSNLKSSVIGPEEVRRAVMKVFPPKLANVTIANLSRVLTT